MNDFIKSQQEFGSKLANKERLGIYDRRALDKIIQQIIANTGEQFLLFVNEKWGKDGGPALVEVDSETQTPAINTLKKHITSLTGVE